MYFSVFIGMSFFNGKQEAFVAGPVSRWFRLLSGCGEQRFHIPEERFGFRNVLAAQRDDFCSFLRQAVFRSFRWPKRVSVAVLFSNSTE